MEIGANCTEIVIPLSSHCLVLEFLFNLRPWVRQSLAGAREGRAGGMVGGGVVWSGYGGICPYIISNTSIDSRYPVPYVLHLSRYHIWGL